MIYQLKYSKEAVKSLQKLDKYTKTIIISWIEKNLINISNPKVIGKALVGNKAGLWRYRIGDYRLIAKIDEENIVILLLNIGHRRDIYK